MILNEQTTPARPIVVAERSDGVSMMSLDLPGIERHMLLKQIENEINAGFVFVAAARNAYQRRLPADGQSALGQARAAHNEALKHAAESELSQVRAIVHQLTELREAIDWLGDAHLKPRAGGQK